MINRFVFMDEVDYPSRPLYVKRCKIYRKMRLTVRRISKSVSFYNLFGGFGNFWIIAVCFDFSEVRV